MDTISQMLTEIRNAQMAGHKEVAISFSKLKLALAKILESEGFIESASVGKDSTGSININLKYYSVSNTKKIPAIRGLRKISRSGQRIYIKSREVKNVKNKFGLAIISTSKGLMTGDQSKKIGLGGEYICEIW